ncbi:fimbrial biogenesis protein FimT [Acinetobacter qingfengensis]|uniref:Uncharacterized protein n=2 Tax=Acinetobacter qingfengensis TaxID=1262585 RepID=A0A1E7RGC6_9GAMM|nr:hypothetical protein [Acinetobacter qingfengensis]KAA8732757.1 fimbrial biogenesis protein FimT [Acinetobacter qingfengensis]OEY98225.1 hypothetical protein BJI46_01000 [Acinetobacter qingfengensis]
MEKHFLPNKSCKGLTITELLVSIFITSAIVVLAIPHFSSLIANLESKKTITFINTVLNDSKHRAFIHHDRIAICGSHDQISCSDDGWSTGLLVFIDQKSPDRIRQSEETILHYYALNLKHGSLSWKGAAGRNLVFQSDSGLPRGSQGSFFYCANDAVNSRRLILSYMGNTRHETIQQCED